MEDINEPVEQPRGPLGRMAVRVLAYYGRWLDATPLGYYRPLPNTDMTDVGMDIRQSMNDVYNQD